MTAAEHRQRARLDRIDEKRARQPWRFHVVRSESGKRFWFAERHNIGGRPSPEVVHVNGDESGAALINVIAQTQE